MSVWVPGAGAQGWEDAFLPLSPSCCASEWLNVTCRDLLILSLGTQAKHPEGRRARPHLGAPAALSVVSCCPQSHPGTSQARHKLGGGLALPSSSEDTGASNLMGEGQPWAEVSQEEEAALPGGVFLHSLKAAATCCAGFRARGSTEVELP